MTTIDPSQWTIVPFPHERTYAPGMFFKGISLAVPNISAVYAVLGEDVDDVLYIGRSKRLKERWNNHQLLPELRSRTGARIAYEACDESLLAERETALLAQYAPILNTPWEIAKAKGDWYRPHMPWVSQATIANLPRRDQSIAAMEFRRQEPPACQYPEMHQDYFVLCTQCVYNLWCRCCMPWACECWKSSRWTIVEIETHDALYYGLSDWREAHPDQTIWHLDKICRGIGGNRMQLAAFSFGLHWPTLWEAEIFASAMQTTLAALEQQREQALARRRSSQQRTKKGTSSVGPTTPLVRTPPSEKETRWTS